jgi:hypothetical protein
VTRPPRRRGLSAAQQAFALSREFPGSRLNVRRGTLVWLGELQPTEISRSYSVRVTLGHDYIPRVRVMSPILDSRAGEPLPHVYSDGTLCLYTPGEWHSSEVLAWTIVPWIAEWLINYEIWLSTGEWFGGGEWPPRRSSTDEVAA